MSSTTQAYRILIKAKDSFLVSTDISFNGEGDNPLGIVVMTFEIPYHHTEGSLE